MCRRNADNLAYVTGRPRCRSTIPPEIAEALRSASRRSTILHKEDIATPPPIGRKR